MALSPDMLDAIRWEIRRGHHRFVCHPMTGRIERYYSETDMRAEVTIETRVTIETYGTDSWPEDTTNRMIAFAERVETIIEQDEEV